jgi:hypothetical protein
LKRRSAGNEFSSELKKLRHEVRNLVEALAEYGPHHSPSRLAELTQSRIERIEENLKAVEAPEAEFPPERTREFVLNSIQNLDFKLTNDRKSAKQAIRKHFHPIALYPEEADDNKLLRADGRVQIGLDPKSVMRLVAPQQR